MKVTIRCPNCDQRLRVPDANVDLVVTCPPCGHKWEHPAKTSRDPEKTTHDPVTIANFNSIIPVFAMAWVALRYMESGFGLVATILITGFASILVLMLSLARRPLLTSGFAVFVAVVFTLGSGPADTSSTQTRPEMAASASGPDSKVKPEPDTVARPHVQFEEGYRSKRDVQPKASVVMAPQDDPKRSESSDPQRPGRISGRDFATAAATIDLKNASGQPFESRASGYDEAGGVVFVLQSMDIEFAALHPVSLQRARTLAATQAVDGFAKELWTMADGRFIVGPFEALDEANQVLTIRTEASIAFSQVHSDSLALLHQIAEDVTRLSEEKRQAAVKERDELELKRELEKPLIGGELRFKVAREMNLLIDGSPLKNYVYQSVLPLDCECRIQIRPEWDRYSESQKMLVTRILHDLWIGILKDEGPYAASFIGRVTLVDSVETRNRVRAYSEPGGRVTIE